MAWLFIIVGTFFSFAGLITALRAMHRRLHWPRVPGTVVGFKEHVSDTDTRKQISYIPQIKFTVRNKEYIAYADQSMKWSKRDFSKPVTVLHNRDDPEEFSLKDDTPLAGFVMLIFGSVFVVLGVSFLDK